MYGDRALDRALTLLETDRAAEALPILEEISQREPKNAQVNFALGIACTDAGDNLAALGYLRKASRVGKKHAPIFEHLARVEYKLGHLQEALKSAQIALSLDATNPDTHVAIGDIYTELRRPVMAKNAYERALKLAPEHVDALLALAEQYRSSGDLEAARDLFERTREVAPDSAAALAGLADLQRFKQRPALLDEIEGLLARDKQPAPHARALLHWAAGKIEDDLDEPAAAFRHFEAARPDHYPPYDHTRYEAFVDALIGLVTPQFLEERRDAALTSEKPVFIVGMPRSGTTLIEQILGRHSRAQAAGELSFFFNARLELGYRPDAPEPHLERIAHIEPKELNRIGRRYLAKLDAIDGKAKRVIDKFPHNFEQLWMLALLFPRATFIHAKRDPADTCASILSKPLRAAHRYSRSQTDLGRYYRAYRKLMDHWHSVLPVKIRDQSYEALIAEQETESRSLLAHAGLDWEDACLEFYKGDSPVATFSQQQVRQPIYNTSIRRWVRYKDEIGVLLDALGDLAPTDR
ncbi:sulfotransferase [Breoghania sp. L-A4]|uniref:tetratricopeptide repeat-containing sulfotransferase family protein n=1 Tax=Breoghania sp. L-A4 TaxID=2304600 RepID=UPI000E35E735|nr:sulfotransferase [Breoghania sp. L-A4]AXS41433.1 sulfotransferase family protein [Breoghania sp. L-A4]